ncbi:unnamed protein product [Adineta ricciae]|uniref:DEP domain-containing protein n=1 Tax=Adineta ricciae TaxID=249248 RepID=A0A814IHQ2_ADIRI|nr:unnamed protein product [Adineta ricciae]CAF1285475.1 unnamed protein product [Adineta ricciae]
MNENNWRPRMFNELTGSHNERSNRASLSVRSFAFARNQINQLNTISIIMYEKPRTTQFRATKMWNNLVQNFRSSIKLKKKRHFFKTYQNCFSSSDAITCMLEILQQQASGSESSSSVTRTQAMTILQSLYNAKIFSDIKEDSSRTGANDPKQFLDNNKIFKLLPQTEENILPTVTAFDDTKSLGTPANNETKASFSPSSVLELMYAFARQKRKQSSMSLFKP